MPKNRMSITIHLVEGEDDDLIKRFSKVTGKARAEMAKTLWRNKPVTIGGQTGDTALLEDIVGRVYWLQEEHTKIPDMIREALSTLRVAAPLAIPPDTQAQKDRASRQALAKRKERDKKNVW